jgi:hypothetical protein
LNPAPNFVWTDRLLRDLGRNWGRQNPERALAWAEDPSMTSGSALIGVVEGMVDSDVDRAIGMLDRLAPDAQAELFGAIARQLAATDMPRALGMLEESRNRPGYSIALTAVVSELVHRDPAAAGALLQNAPAGSSALYASSPFS